MMRGLLQDWLGRYDPIHRGWTRAGIANGLTATNGFSFSRIRGGYNLYRTVAGEPGGPVLVGAAGADDTQVEPFAWVRHEPQAEYTYRLVPVGGGGVENWTDRTETSVLFDAAGDWRGPLPNPPTDLQVLALSLGRMAVRWSYYPQGEQAKPQGFYLYRDEGGEIEYGNVVGQVGYRRGRVHYEYVSGSFGEGDRVGWAVRAFAGDGREEQNLNAVFGLARRLGPPANPVVKVTVV